MSRLPPKDSNPSAQNRILRLRTLAQEQGVAVASREVAQALRLSPRDPNLLHFGAELAEASGEMGRAIALLRRAASAYPSFVEAAYNLARLLERGHQESEAAAILKAALAHRPDFTPGWRLLTRLAQTLSAYPDAIHAAERWVAQSPNDPVARGQLHILRASIADWRERPRTDEPLSPHAAVSFLDNAAAQLAAARQHVAQKYAAIKPLPGRAYAPHERLRVGYLSSDFHAHATAWLIAELFELHDRAQFEIFAYSYGVDDGSAVRKRIAASAEHFVTLNDLTPHACAMRIQADEIDILIDLKGHTRGSHLDILAYRPAPIQAHWLGYPGTLGAPFIDVYFGDAVTLPPALEPFFDEKPVRLEPCYQINDRQRTSAPPPSREEAGLPPTGFVFACLNQTLKITPEMFDLWCDILREVPDSVLWLYAANAAVPPALREQARQRGVDPDRLVFAPPLPQDQHLARYAHADLALDTFPYGGHTTTSDALWAGVPVVTREGQSFASRVAASLLHAAGLDELVTETSTAYRALVLDLARDDTRRQRLKTHLLQNRNNLPLFDTPRFVANLENRLRELQPKK